MFSHSLVLLMQKKEVKMTGMKRKKKRKHLDLYCFSSLVSDDESEEESHSSLSWLTAWEDHWNQILDVSGRSTVSHLLSRYWLSTDSLRSLRKNWTDIFLIGIWPWFSIVWPKLSMHIIANVATLDKLIFFFILFF